MRNEKNAKYVETQQKENRKNGKVYSFYNGRFPNPLTFICSKYEHSLRLSYVLEINLLSNRRSS